MAAIATAARATSWSTPASKEQSTEPLYSSISISGFQNYLLLKNYKGIKNLQGKKIGKTVGEEWNSLWALLGIQKYMLAADGTGT